MSEQEQAAETGIALLEPCAIVVFGTSDDLTERLLSGAVRDHIFKESPRLRKTDNEQGNGNNF